MCMCVHGGGVLNFMIAAGDGESQCINRRHGAASDRAAAEYGCVCQIKWRRNRTGQFNGFVAAVFWSAGETG